MKFTRRWLMSLPATLLGGQISLRGSGHSSEANQKRSSIDHSREKKRKLLYSLLGDLPDRRRTISARLVSRTQTDKYQLERLELDLKGLETVPAYVVLPHQVSEPVPAVLYNHSHGGGYTIGKDEFLEGREYLQNPPYAEVLAELGWAGLCIDSWAFGERSHTSETDTFKAMLWQGQVLWGMMVYTHLRTATRIAGQRMWSACRPSPCGDGQWSWESTRFRSLSSLVWCALAV